MERNAPDGAHPARLRGPVWALVKGSGSDGLKDRGADRRAHRAREGTECTVSRSAGESARLTDATTGRMQLPRPAPIDAARDRHTIGGPAIAVSTRPRRRPAIVAEGLVKVYRSRKSEVRALDGVDLVVDEGTVLGLLGPNGAGKTTTVRILATLLRADAGRATVAGFDVRTQADDIRRVIGLSGQYAAVDENLTGRENLWLFGRLYHLPSRGGATPRGRAARAVRAHRRRRPRRQDLLGRHAAAPRPRARR